jgi:hypothetical protein
VPGVSTGRADDEGEAQVKQTKAEREAEWAAIRARQEREAKASRRVRETAHRLFGDDVGCGDGGCVFGHLGGQHTNGGCRCISTHRDDAHATARVAMRFARIARALAEELC